MTIVAGVLLFGPVSLMADDGPQVPEVLAPALLTEPHGFQPGQLIYRNIINDRTTNVAYHNGNVFTHNVTGVGRRAWRWDDLSDVQSFEEFDFPGGIPLFNDQGNHAHTKMGPWLGGRWGFQLRYEGPGLNVRDGNFPPEWRFHQEQSGTRHNLYWPWGLVFDWVQYDNQNNGAVIYRAGERLYEFNPLNEYGVTGNGILLGNILFITSDETANGILSFDISAIFNEPPAPPVLLDKLAGPFGGYIAVPYKNYLILSRRVGRTVDVIDSSDPTNLTFVTSIDTGGINSGVPYVQAQDNYIFTQSRKINMDTFEIEVSFDEDDIDRPPGSVPGALDISQYMRPVGPYVITGGMNASGRNGVGIWVHQEGPDLRAPYVGWHMPRPGQTNFPVGAPISLLIHKTLETFTIVNGESIILRELGTTDPIDAWTSFAHDGVLTLTPMEYLEADTIYELVAASRMPLATASSPTALPFPPAALRVATRAR